MTTAYAAAMGVALVLVGYLLGSLPIGLWLARRGGRVDPRSIGSRNPGATNVYRASGLAPALAVMALDMGKGGSAVVLSRLCDAGEPVAVAAGVAAVVGHVFPVWLRGRGGKGVATACGAFWMLAPVATVAAMLAFATVVAVTRTVSAASLAATLTLPSMALAGDASPAVVIGAALTAVLIAGRHHGNLVRLIAGTEPPLGRYRENHRA